MFPVISSKSLERMKAFCAVVVVATGLMVLFGWWQDIGLFIYVHKSFQAMNPLTALNFVLTGIALYISNRCVGRRALGVLLIFCCFFVLMTSSLRILDISGITQFDIDHLLFSEKVNDNPMKPVAALNFILACFGLLGVNFRWCRKILPPEIIIVPPLLLLSMGLLGCVVDIVLFQELIFIIPVPIHTAMVFWILCAGIIMTPYAGGMAGVVLEKNGPLKPHQLIYRIIRQSPLAWILLVISILVTGTIWRMSSQSMRAEVDKNFNLRCAEINSVILSRIDSCELILSGARGLFHASNRVTYDEWADYAKSLHINDAISELKGIGFISYVRAGQLQGFLKKENKERTLPLQPRNLDNAAADFFIVNYFDQVPGSSDLIGSDFGQDPRIRRALERTLETDSFSMSPVIVLEGESSRSFDIFLPVYDIHRVGGGNAPRGKAGLAGWVFGVFNVDDLMQKVRGSTDPGIRFEIFDGPSILAENLIYSSTRQIFSSSPANPERFHSIQNIFFPGHQWTVRYSSLPAFELTFSDRQSSIILNAGLLLSILLFGVTWSLSNTRAHAEEIAERMTAELKIKDKAFASVNNGILISDATRPDMPIIYVNEAFCRITGYSPEDVIGKNCRFLQNDDRQQPAIEEIRHALKTGIPCDTVLRNYRKDGTLFYNEFSISPIKSVDGKISHFVGIQHDITERKNVERNLKESERKYRTVVDSVQEVIFQMDIRGHWIFLSAAWGTMTGYQVDESLGHSFLRYIHPLDRTMISENFRGLLTKSDASCRLEVRVLSKDDTYQWTELTIQKRPGEKGERMILPGTIMNISERKRAEEMTARARDAAIQSARMKADFLANMSHEIRTPLNGIVGMAGLLADSSLGREQKDFVQTIRSCADSLMGIINDILDFSKIEAGKLSFETLDFNLRNAVENSMDMVSGGMGAKSIELAFDIHDDVPVYLQGDPGRLKQILVNLINNAAKFTEKGEVVITISVDSFAGEKALIKTEVRDTGIGISPDKLQDLFQPFVQADTSTTRKYGGTGLGLSISRQLVTLMGGTMGVHSELGAGSTFWFTIPFDLQSQPPKGYDPSGSHLKGARVLILDDNETNRRILLHQLKNWDLLADELADSRLAFDTLMKAKEAGSPYDILLLDMQMPFLDGLGVAKAIQSYRGLSELSILLMTSGSPGSQEMAFYKAFGIRQCLTKPLKQSVLFDALSCILEHSLASSTAASTPVPMGLRDSSEKKSFRILIAEDNITNQKVALLQLAKLGYEADTVANGLEVIEALSRIPYKIILMDCQMPEMDGYTASSVIRMNEKDDYHPVIIAMTAHAMEGDEKKCLDAGMDDYISKPVNMVSLKTILEKWTKKIG